MTFPLPLNWFGWRKIRFASAILSAAAAAIAADPEIRTPPPPATPQVHGPSRFGARPGSPFLYAIPATGDLPIAYSADGLPAGLKLDGATGQITGQVRDGGHYRVTLHASNARGVTERPFEIIIGEAIALTPAMGWNSWNCWAEAVTQDKILRSAHAMVSAGLARHGWTYINIDDTWQGARTGRDRALQPNAKFPDLGALVRAIHQMGLKAGIYSTPWVTSYAHFPGGAGDRADGAWTKALANDANERFGQYSFAVPDANQWAEWGFDYLKYDWRPNDVLHTADMSTALLHSGRDIVFSLSNAAPFEHAADWARLANSWRTTCDIFDGWVMNGPYWQYGVSEIGFNQDRWAPSAGPGHWNDPDMLVVGDVGWGKLHPSRLTPDEQYTHISLWCMLSAPLLIGCDLEHLDQFTLNLLTNDEVLAVDQDALGKQAVRVATAGAVDIFRKELEDGSIALGFFNRGDTAQTLNFNKMAWIGIDGPQHVRDLWRQKDLPDLGLPVDSVMKVTIAAHGAELFKLRSVR